MKFLNKDGKIIVMNLVATVQENKKYLSDIDGLIGDGDHGINMNKGFTLCGERLKVVDKNFSESLKELGYVLLSEIGGSMGPLYGTLFIKMARRCKNEPEIDADVFGAMLHEACSGLSEIGNAKVGDKTIMDVLLPATAAYDKALEYGKNFSEALVDMKAAANAGMNATKDMVAKVGRASRLGERSKDVLDAGAVSCDLLLESMADTMMQLMQ